MYNFETQSYVAAEEITYKFNDLARMWIKFMFIFLKASFLSLIESIKFLFKVVFPSESKQVSGQLALVTGGANGLGREIARRFAREGCNIVIVDLDLIGGEKTAKEIESEFNVKTKVFKVDVSNYEEVLKLRNDVESSIGTVDILVNNAGLLAMMSLEDSRHEDVQKIIDVNITSHFWTCQIFLKGMIERKRGHILAICSMVAKVTYPLATVYCATQHGIDGFMNALYDELSVKDQDEFIKLTTAYPGFINTSKYMSDMLDNLCSSPRLSPGYTAKSIVNALLQNKRSIIIPGSAHFVRLIQLFPDPVMRNIKLYNKKIKNYLNKMKIN